MFSSGVRLGDLDDFLAPAQDCVAPLLIENGKVTVAGKIDTRVGIAEAPVVMQPDLIKKKMKEDTAKAEVSLSDCLACSGCVTSAETVLLQEQSADEFIRRAQVPNTTVVMSVSPESLVSLSAHFALDAWTTMTKLAHVFSTQFGVHFVCDMHAAHLVHRWESKRTAGSDCMLSSTCPGWTLYAEKVCDPSILPKLTPLRSPQHIQGLLIKRHFWQCVQRQWDVHQWTRYGRLWMGNVEARLHPWHGASEHLYHVMVSPCFDRKIEAVRPAYTLENGDREVDTVLATTEILALLPDDFSEMPSGTVYNAWNMQALSHMPAVVWFWDDYTEGWTEIRHDLYERKHDDGTKSIRAYGFKNIQNAIRRVRTAKGRCRDSIRMIEVMACPSACLNGGGQIRDNAPVERLAELWPRGEIPDEDELYRLYEQQPTNYWQAEFRSLKGASLKW